MANNLFFELDAEFLKTPLNAKVFHKDKTTLLLVEPQPIEHANDLDINELIAKLKGDASEIGNAFGGKTEGVKVRLAMAYLRYLQTESDTPAAGNEDNPDKVQAEATNEMEYALKLDVLDINTLPIFEKIGDIITVNKATLAVWNTNDAAVTDKMNLAIPAFTTKAIPQTGK